MTVEVERLVRTNQECGAEFADNRKPARDEQNLTCASETELKQLYHPPVLTVYGTLVRHYPSRC